MKKEGLIDKAFIFRGLVATGKSEVAKVLESILIENSLKTEILRTDKVRKEEIPKDKLTYSDEERLWVYGEMGKKGNNLASYGIIVIYDSTCNEKRYLNAIKTTLSPKITPILIETVCPEEVSLKRIKKRIEENKDLSDAGIEEYYKIKKKYDKIIPDFEINNSGTIELVKPKLIKILNSL